MQFYRINDGIRSRLVRVILPDGQQLGVLPLKDALFKAKELSLDLIEIAPTVNPPVCKIADFGKFKFEISKREKQSRKNQHEITTKCVNLTPNIGDNDLNRKIEEIKKFLDKGNKVLVSVKMSGRQNAHPEIALAHLKKIQEITGFPQERPTKQMGKITIFLYRSAHTSAKTEIKVKSTDPIVGTNG